MEFNYLKNILDDLFVRFESKYSPSSYQLKRQLCVLNRNEKLLIRKKILDYNIGALQVLEILCETGILSLTGYLENLPDEAEMQGIIADVLDSDDMMTLLKEIVISGTKSESINCNFQECLHQYVVDVVLRPELIRNEFITKIESQLPSNIFKEMIAFNFINELLSFHSNDDSHSINDLTQIISIQKQWNVEYQEEKFNLLTKILNNLSINHSHDIGEYLLKQLQMKEVNNWFYMLFLIKHIKEEANLVGEFKKFFKNLLKKFHEMQENNNLYLMFILARQLFHYRQENSCYKSWVKLTIGELHYNLKDQEKFTFALQALQNMIFFENDLNVLEIHAQTSITSPRGSLSLIHEYKQLLKTRINALSSPEIVMDLT
ncbi:CLUMA_CG018466, isoform A [Clunio marinus]|uniref:CLUMA_CG018466, isoform A n=1 Tax=Clunio marinus TaxID=568069 RepID=A0A1J1J2F9_9DIPT|nr:CLUMA_CG018466, isoform A [Clunio marinus]